MPDPWLEGEELKKHEEAVAEDDLTKQAEGLREQEKELVKAMQEEREEASAEEKTDSVEARLVAHPSEESGYSADVASGGMGPSGDAQAPEPAGNVDSDLPTQNEVEEAASEDADAAADDDAEADKGDAKGKAAAKKTASRSKKS